MITRIIYCAANCNMGETSETDCDNYRAWAYAEIEKKYLETVIEVRNVDGKTEVEVEGGPFSYESCKEWDVCQEWLAELWDRCPWSGKFFD